MLGAIVFDLHGVLLDDAAAALAALREPAAAAGRARAEAAGGGRAAGRDERALLAAVAREQGKAPPPPDALRRLAEARARRTAEALAADGLFFPGATKVVKDAARKAPLALLADVPRHEASLALKEGGIFDRFTAIVGVEQVPRPRPDPSGPLAALALVNRDRARLGKSEVGPRHVLAVEDTGAGVAAAKAAGFKVVAVGHTQPPHALSQADAFVARILDVSLDALERELF